MAGRLEGQARAAGRSRKRLAAGLLSAIALIAGWSASRPTVRAEPSQDIVRENPAFGLALVGRGPNASQAPLVFRLEGPNDGEPLERGRLPVWIVTNYSDDAEIHFRVEGTTASRILYRPAPTPDADGVSEQRYSLDLFAAGTRLGVDLLSPDYGPITVSASLCDAERNVLTQMSWSGFPGRPWLEFVVVDTDDEPVHDPFGDYWDLAEELTEEGPAYDYGDDPLVEFWDLLETITVDDRQLPEEAPDPRLVPQESIGVIPHFRTDDTFYFLSSSEDAEGALLAPDHPAFAVANWILSFGPLSSDVRGSTIYFEEWYRIARQQQHHLVLWVYNGTSGGWERSLVHHSRP